jgi:hypothetical protein
MKNDLPPMHPADDEELRSAAALARALDGGPAEPELPQAALETAALLRLSAGAGLDDERRAQIKRELLAGLASTANAKAARPQRHGFALPRWLLLAFPVAGVAALSLLVFVQSPEPAAQFRETAAVSASARDEEVQRSAGNPAPSASAVAPELPRRDLSASEVAASEVAAREVPVPSDVAAPKIARSARMPSLRAAEPGGHGNPTALSASAADAPSVDLARAAPDEGAQRALVGLGKEVSERRTELLARVGDAALDSAHAQLDAASSRPELERSQGALRRALDTLGDGPDPSDAHLVRQDLYCRLAETALRLGEPRAALEWTRHGLDLDGPPTPFLAQLSALEGDAWAALGDEASAATSYMQALRVHEALLDESLHGR